MCNSTIFGSPTFAHQFCPPTFAHLLLPTFRFWRETFLNFSKSYFQKPKHAFESRQNLLLRISNSRRNTRKNLAKIKSGQKSVGKSRWAKVGGQMKKWAKVGPPFLAVLLLPTSFAHRLLPTYFCSLSGFGGKRF